MAAALPPSLHLQLLLLLQLTDFQQHYFNDSCSIFFSILDHSVSNLMLGTKSCSKNFYILFFLYI